ncbi:MAG TPA: ShlB/FhaC/HecB family hemolysin secretion/activation protein [Burkholderiales bacterium]|nr:ShlB/FhaC/HecB family hemolysin secretion/activation protein [Burkholderiales bacterium]
MAQIPSGVIERPSEQPLPAPEFLPDKDIKPFELPTLERPDEAPAGGEPQLDVEGFVFDGNKVIPTDILEQVAEPYAHRRLSIAQLEELRQKLTHVYIDRGYINSGVLLEDGFLQNGVVRFRVIEGRVQGLRTSGLGGLLPSYLRQRLVQEGEVLNVNALQERFQLLLSDPLFSKVNARLEPGERPGLATLDVEVTRARPWELSIYANNHRPPSIGTDALGIAGTVRNLSGVGDTLFASAETGLDDEVLFNRPQYDISWTAPVVYRTDLLLHYEYGSSSVIEEPLDSLNINSRFESYEAGLSHAFVDSPARRVSVGVIFNRRKNSTELLGIPFSFVAGEPTGTSTVRATRFQQDWIERWERQALAVRSTFSWGQTNTIASTDPTVAPESYFVWLGQANFVRRVLQNGANVSLRGTVQATQDRLVPLEQFALGGVFSVRGYIENQVVRDRGYNASIEFRYPIFQNPGQRYQVMVVPFFDFGGAKNQGEESQQLSSIGLGLTAEHKGFLGELFYGYQLDDIDAKKDGTLQNHGIHLQVRYAF